MTVAGAPATKASRLVAPGEAVVVLGPPPPFVGRGGHKLEAALDHFGITVSGRHVLDAGASTGGFTDCALQRGAAQVVAVDVGRGQLHARLRSDPRVVVMEGTNVRQLTPQLAGRPADVVCVDLSFISLRTVLPALLGVLAPGGDLVALVKPQFEAGRQEASKGRGVIRDPAVWARVLGEVIDAAAGLGAAMMGAMVSPITGADGNVEFLVHLRAAGELSSPPAPVDVDAVVAEAVARHGA